MKGLLKHIAPVFLCVLLFTVVSVHSADVTPTAKKHNTHSGEELDRIIAKVDQDVIMQSEFDARLKAVRMQFYANKIPLPPDEMFKNEVLEQLILENIQIQMGKRAGIHIDEWELNDTISLIAKRNQMTLSEFKKNIEESGTDFSQAREDIRREIILNRVRQSQIARRIQVSEQDIDNFLSSPEGLSQLPTEYRLAHILIAIPEYATKDQIASAERLASDLSQKLHNGEEFQALAMTYSNGQNAHEGGDLGWMKANQLPTLFAEHALKMSKGETSEVIRSPGGFHIIKLVDVAGDESVLQKQFHVRHILVKPTKIRSDFESQRQLKQVYERIQGGEEFGELAKAYSDDTATALNGGDMGWIIPDTLVPEFQEVMKKIPEKVVSEPFRTEYGWHILEVVDIRQTDISNQVRRNKIRELLSNRKYDNELQFWLREIRDQAYVEIQL